MQQMDSPHTGMTLIPHLAGLYWQLQSIQGYGIGTVLEATGISGTPTAPPAATCKHSLLVRVFSVGSYSACTLALLASSLGFCLRLVAGGIASPPSLLTGLVFLIASRG